MGATVDLNIEVEKREGYAIISVGGEVDVFTAPKLREQLINAVEEGQRRIIIGLEGVEFLDSTGLGVLVAGLKRVKTNGGTLAIVCTKERILKIFRITGLTKVFPIFSSLQEAMAQSEQVADEA